MVDHNEKIDNLLEYAYSLLKNNEWDGADNIAEEILDLDSQDSDAYLIKLMAKLKVPSTNDFGNLDEQLSGYFFQKALLYADANQKKRLESYNILIETSNADQITVVI